MRISGRWLWIVVPLALVAATATVRVVFLQRDVRRELGDDIQGPLRIAEAQVEGWTRRHLDRAVVVAGLLSSEPTTFPRTENDASMTAFQPRFDAIARAAIGGNEHAGAWLLDGRGRLRGAPIGDRTVTTGIGSGAPPPRSPGDSRTAHMITRACEGGYCADAFAPLAVRDSAVGWAVLSRRIADPDFPRLGTSARTKTGRTTLLARLGDSVVVLATDGRDTANVPPRALAFDSTPAHIRAALEGQARGGTAAPGLSVERSIYSSARLPTTGWVLLREMQGDELVGWILLPAASEIALVASIFLFGFGYLRSRLRIAALHREQEATRVRADFLAGASHELRTPLAKIRMFAELVRTGSLAKPGEAERALRIIEKEASRLSILADNILSYVRLRRPESVQRTPVTVVPTEIARDVEQVVAEFGLLAGERWMRVVSDVDGDPRAAVDSQALRQILLNFLDNAMKYGSNGQTVTVGARADATRVRVWVDDQGPGVPPGERDVVWSLFHRGEAASRSGNSGSGIGLAVVRDLALRHGGAAWVETAPGGGARFVAEFPRADEHVEPQASRREVAS